MVSVDKCTSSMDRIGKGNSRLHHGNLGCRMMVIYNCSKKSS